MKRSRRPRTAQPDKLEKDKLAAASSATADTLNRRGGSTPTEENAPCPAAAHQRRRKDGALMTPTTGTPSESNAISVAHTGTPRTKFLVPSMGSITHCRPLISTLPPSSSPNTESLGRW